MRVSFAKLDLPGAGVVVVSAYSGNNLSASAIKLDSKIGGAITRGIRASRFKGNTGQILSIAVPSAGRIDRVMLVGLGKISEITELEMQKLGGNIYWDTRRVVNGNVAVAVDPIPDAKMSAFQMAAQMAYGARLRSYRFDKYKTKLKAADKPSIKAMTFHCQRFSDARK